MVLECSLGAIRLVVSNILAFSLPSKLAALSRVLQGVNQRSHTFGVGRIGFHKIAEIESVRLILPGVLYPEVVPLREALRAVVILKEQIVLEWPDLHRLPEVAALEPGLEDEGLVRRQLHLRRVIVYLSTDRVVGGLDAWHRTLLVVRVLLDLGVHAVVRLQFLVVAVQPRSTYALPLLRDLRLWLIGVDLPEMIVLLQAVRQILWVEVVTLLIRLIDRAIALVLGTRQLYDVLLVDVRTVFGILALIKGRILKIVVNDLKSIAAAAVDCPIGVIAHVLIEQRLPDRIFDQFLKFHLVSVEELVAQVLHHGILHARSGQVLDMLLIAGKHVIYHHLLLIIWGTLGLLILV